MDPLAFILWVVFVASFIALIALDIKRDTASLEEYRRKKEEQSGWFRQEWL